MRQALCVLAASVLAPCVPASCVLASCALALTALVPASPALAHAFLKTATPAVGASVPEAPSQVVIDFTEGVEPAFSTIAVQDAAGARMDTGAAHLAGGAQHLAVALGPLPPGAYTVTWHATSTDTHRTEGSFAFTVGR